uniref:Uncharacterized protein n=1 Tax=Panagrellus redivivus TaxID=6233 RepID=A0A7E4V0E0_PANRE
MNHVSLNHELLDEVTDEIFINLIEARITKRPCRKLALLVGALCFTGREVLRSMTSVFSDYVEGEILNGDMKIKLEDGVLMHEHSFLIPLYRASIGRAHITLGEPGTPEYAKNLQLCDGAKIIRQATIFPGPIPAGGIPELKSMFSRLEVLRCPVYMILTDVKHAFPRLLNLTIDGSVPNVLKFFENADNLPLLSYFYVNLGGNVETFINNFVPSRTPKLKTFIMESAHYGDGVFDKVDIFHRFANSFPKLASVIATVVQTRVVFNTDPAYYIEMHKKFTAAKSKAVVFLKLEHNPVTELPNGLTLDHKYVLNVLKPLGYCMNPDHTGYCKNVGVHDRTLTHHVIVELPLPAFPGVSQIIS